MIRLTSPTRTIKLQAYQIAIWSILTTSIVSAADFPKPYSGARTERENIFEFTQAPKVVYKGDDRYEISFTVKGNCDVTVGVVDTNGKVIRHLASGVLGKNAPKPFQKDSLKQTLVWNGKDDLDHYVKNPAKLSVQVSLGLKPTFDKRIGGTSAKNIPGYIWGIVTGPEGVYVIGKGHGAGGHLTIRKFDRDGKYQQSLLPPPPNLPSEKLKGLSYIEYEKGKKALHGAQVRETVQRDGYYFIGIGGKHGPGNCQPVLIGNRIYFANAGPSVRKGNPSLLHYVYTDGSTDIEGIKGTPLTKNIGHSFPRFASSADGKKLFVIGLGSDRKNGICSPIVMVRNTSGTNVAKPFFGSIKKSGKDESHLNGPVGLDVDSQGRVYISDQLNNRIMIVSDQGKFLKQIPIKSPQLLRVHQKTGSLYVLHSERVKGKSRGRLTKFSPYPPVKKEFHTDGISGSVMALDSWSQKPRVWIGGGKIYISTVDVKADSTNVKVYEESTGSLKKIIDFEDDAKKEAGKGWFGRWSGNRGHGFPRVVCDPTRETLYVDRKIMFDLKTGNYLGPYKVSAYAFEDIDFDKRGFMHVHFNPGFYTPGVGRVDPSKMRPVKDKNGNKISAYYSEVPYDYGITAPGKYGPSWTGVLPVKDQRGAKYFQDGMGVNMRGDIAVESNIYYVPKMEDTGYAFAQSGLAGRKKAGEYGGGKAGAWSYQAFIQEVRQKEKAGEEVYSIARRPGLDLAGGTIWTFEWTGELRQECAVSAGKLINSARIDEDGCVYFVNNRTRTFQERPFLSGQAGTIGLPEDKNNRHPFTGTLIKTKPNQVCSVYVAGSPIKLDPLPSRPADMLDVSFEGVFNDTNRCWVDGAEWMYAGASGIVSNSCSCPTMRIGLDWYKRTFVPEIYRHSVGVLDTAGNVILHIGRYGNFDSCSGPNSKIKIGGDEIGMFFPRFVSTTDNYMAFEDWGERIVVLKLNYHTQKTIPIDMK